MRTLLVCALATTLVGCSSQQSKQPSCVGLNPLACLTAVDVPIEAELYDSDAATTKPVSRVAWRGDSSPRPQAQHAMRRTPKPIKVAAKAAPAIPIPVRSPQASQQTTDNAVASETARVSETALASATDPQTTTDVPHARTRRSRWRPPPPSRNACRSRPGCVAGRSGGRPRDGSRHQVGLRPGRQDHRDRRSIFRAVDQPRQDRDGGGGRA